MSADSITGMENHTHPNHNHAHHDRTRYGLPFFLILGFAIFEAWGGWWTHSLALWSDAGHMFTDVLSLGLAWMAANLAGRPNVKRHHGGLSYPEFGASFINIMLMIIVIVGIVTEALARLQSPPNVAGGAVVWIALVGLIVNLIVAMQLQHQAHEYGENLNNQAAYLHVLGDLLGSIAAIVAGAVIYFTGWQKIDPILSLLSALLLVVMTVSLAYRLYTRFSGQAHD